MGGHERSSSFANLDKTAAHGRLASVLQETHALLGGSCMGTGLKRAALHYLEHGNHHGGTDGKPAFLQLPGAQDLNPDVAENLPREDAFYVVDIGIVVSQVYQWRRFFPRIEPFYAVKCNPDPVIVKTLAILGCNFDCASRQEIQLVKAMSKDLPRQPEIIYANPCKARFHLLEAVCSGVNTVTFDNAAEIIKCASISKKIKLILRIMTDDRGSQCRLSSKFGAPRFKWKPLLAAAKQHGMAVVGVSFHVGSGCRDASRYEAALQDAREIFDVARAEYGMEMNILDIGGGFPGETHGMWNPAVEIDQEEEEKDKFEGRSSSDDGVTEPQDDRFMFFTEIAEQVAPVIDRLFPPESGVRVIGEPGRYFVAACATLCCSVISSRINQLDASFEPEPVNDKEASDMLSSLSRQEERDVVRTRAGSVGNAAEADAILTSIQEELADYSMLFASQQLTQQEVDVYKDGIDLWKEGYESAVDMLGPPDDIQKRSRYETVEGIPYPLVAASGDEVNECNTTLLTLAAAGEAAVNGVVLQAVADSAPLQDDYAYYINDGVYGAFNNIMFDHAVIRPRVLLSDKERSGNKEPEELFSSTVFGPTCDSIDVIARSVLLPKLNVGDWMYFENMGAYTMAASSTFNGFAQSEKMYTCSVQPEYFEDLVEELITGIDGDAAEEEKKEEKL